MSASSEDGKRPACSADGRSPLSTPVDGAIDPARAGRIKRPAAGCDAGGGSGCGDHAAVRPGALPEDLGSLTPWGGIKDPGSFPPDPAGHSRDSRAAAPPGNSRPADTSGNSRPARPRPGVNLPNAHLAPIEFAEYAFGRASGADITRPGGPGVRGCDVVAVAPAPLGGAGARDHIRNAGESPI